jgi:thiosulfate reductase / polysulfide reductase chain A
LEPSRKRRDKSDYSETIAAKVKTLIHPKAVFVVHGFGRRLPVESRAFGKGLADNRFMQGGLEVWDPAGVGIAMQEHFVTVSKRLSVRKKTLGEEKR